KERQPGREQFLLCAFCAFCAFCGLFYWRKNRRRVVSNADRKSGVWTEAGETFDTGKIETQPRGSDLHSESRFAVRFSAEWTIAGTRVGAAINFTRNTELFVDAINSGEAVRDDVVL